MSSTPVHTALTIVLIVGVLGLVISLVSTRLRFARFEHVAQSIKAIARSLKGDISRQGKDLLVSGIYQGLPTFVRFSYAEGTPGLTIHMRAHASFAFSVTPSHTPIPEPTRTVMPTGEAPFDDRFTISTDQPTMATLLLTRHNFAHVQKLCCSNQTALHIMPGEIDLTENAIPATATWEHVMLHIQSMKTLAEAVEVIPGSEKIVIPPLDRDLQIPGRIAIAVGVLAAIVVVIGSSSRPAPLLTATQRYIPEGMAPNDAIQVRNLDNWRLAAAEDFQPDALGWLRTYGAETNGVIHGDFSGLGYNTDVAYVLVDKDHRLRLVVLANHLNRYDSEFEAAAAIARIPRNSAASITWSGLPPRPISSDGILVVRDANDRSSSVALFLSGGRVISGTPADYQSVQLR